MIGSWAGAMGQTQFLPSAFLAYAVDADGDGRRDIWGSMADVTGVDREFPGALGLAGRPALGRRGPAAAGFDVGRADDGVRQSSAQWAAEGVQTLDGTPLPEFADGAILLPAGARGPAFLVGPNFRAHPALQQLDQLRARRRPAGAALAGGPGVQAPWPRDLPALSRSQLQDAADGA